jgi:hypothetical protein
MAIRGYLAVTEASAQTDSGSALRLVVHGPRDSGRAAVEAFIAGIYAQRYGARVATFTPHLVSLQDDAGIVAAAGYRSADSEPLYLERYLDAPIEQILARQTGVQSSRAGLFEVGHLAARRAGEGRRLIHLLGQHWAQQHCQWVVSTLTQELRHLFLRIGVTPLALGRADPAVLGADAASWGSYYDHAPVVLAGHLGLALRNLKRHGMAQ